MKGAYGPLKIRRHRQRGAASTEADRAGQIPGLPDGVYELAYRGSDGFDDSQGVALAIVRSGAILGCDQGGCMFTGTFKAAGDDVEPEVRLTLDVPASGTLVTGFDAGPDGARVDVVTKLTAGRDNHDLSVAVDGRTINVRLRYIGQISPL